MKINIKKKKSIQTINLLFQQVFSLDLNLNKFLKQKFHFFYFIILY